MANYCWNNIEVSPSGMSELDTKNFKKFLGKIVFMEDELGEEGDIFEYFLGKRPEDADSVAYYGCRPIGDVSDFLSQCEVDNLDDTFFCAGFDSCWSPPEGFCQMLSEMYQVSVKIVYDESGNDFSGHSQYTNGETDFKESWAYQEGLYNMDKDWFWNEVESTIEYCSEEEMDVDEFLEDYGFLTQTDLKELKEKYVDALNKILTENK